MRKIPAANGWHRRTPKTLLRKKLPPIKYAFLANQRTETTGSWYAGTSKPDDSALASGTAGLYTNTGNHPT
jgi:hypothetical protein